MCHRPSILRPGILMNKMQNKGHSLTGLLLCRSRGTADLTDWKFLTKSKQKIYTLTTYKKSPLCTEGRMKSVWSSVLKNQEVGRQFTPGVRWWGERTNPWANISRLRHYTSCQSRLQACSGGTHFGQVSQRCDRTRTVEKSIVFIPLI